MFLATKHNFSKRFELDSGESLVPGLQTVIDHGSHLGVENIFLVMPHRGRLTLLGNVAGKPFEHIFN